MGVALASEVTYPISEATPIGFMVMGGMVIIFFFDFTFCVLFYLFFFKIWSAVLIFAMSGLIAIGKLHWACYLVGLQSAASYFMMWLFNGRLNRTLAEEQSNLDI